MVGNSSLRYRKFAYGHGTRMQYRLGRTDALTRVLCRNSRKPRIERPRATYHTVRPSAASFFLPENYVPRILLKTRHRTRSHAQAKENVGRPPLRSNHAMDSLASPLLCLSIALRDEGHGCLVSERVSLPICAGSVCVQK